MHVYMHTESRSAPLEGVLVNYKEESTFICTHELTHNHTHIRTNTHRARNCSNMAWLRLVGSIKLQVSYAEYSLFCRALLQERPIILSILLVAATQ